MIKKIFSLILTVTLIASCISIGHAQNDTSSEATLGYEFSFLKDLGIIKESDSIYLKKANDKVTRGEFALIAYRLYNGILTETSDTIFTDVTGGGEQAKAINVMASQKILNGFGDGTFRPDEEIQFHQALKILLTMMGYFNYTQKDWLVAGRDICIRHGLLKASFLSKADATLGGLSELVFKLIQAPMFESVGVSTSGDVNYDISDKTILSTYFDIYRVSGILQYDGVTDITSASGSSGGDVVYVDSLRLLNSDKIYFGECLGYNVDAFYYGKNDPRLFSMYKNDKNNFVRISSAQLSEFNNWQYTYYPDGKSGGLKREKLNYPHITVLYNGELLMDFGKNKMEPENGCVELIDNNNDSVYDVVSIKEYTSFVVGNIYSIDEKVVISSKDILAASNIYVDTEELFSLRNSEDVHINFDGIAQGDVISALVCERNSQKYAKEIVVCDKRIQGKVESILSEENDTIYTINSTDYRAGIAFDTESISAGVMGVFYLDFMDNIVYVDNEASLSNVASGYLLNAAIKDGLGKKLQIKIFDELERVHVYDCADKIRIDDTVYRNVDSALAALQDNGSTKQDLILFKVNSAMEVTTIDQPTEFYLGITTKANDTLVKMADETGTNSSSNSGRGMYYFEDSHTFGGRFIIDQSSKLFEIPMDLQDEENFDVISVNDLVNGRYYNIQGYTTDVNSPICNMNVIRPNGKEIESKSSAAVVEQIRNSTNPYGEDTYLITLFDQDGEKKYKTKNLNVIDAAYADKTSYSTDTYQVGEGDIVRYRLNSEGLIDRITIAYDYSADTMLNGQVLATSFASSPRIVNAIPYAMINDNYLRLVDTSTGDFGNLKITDFELVNLSRYSKIYNVNIAGGDIQVTEGGPECVYTYANFGAGSCSKIVLSGYDRTEKVLFVYNNN